MLEPEEFCRALHAMTALLPQQKTLSQEVLVFAWASFPETAKRQMTPTHLAFACDQRLKDPDPDLGRAVHIQLLTYVYPMIDGVSRMDNGFRSDLAIRMAAPDRFHCLTTRYEPKLPDLPAPVYMVPSITPEEKRARIEQLNRIAHGKGNN